VRKAFGRSVSAMRGGESVVDVNVAVLCERGHEIRLVLFFAFMEAGVFEHENLPGLQDRNRPFGVCADAIRREQHHFAERFREHTHERLERLGFVDAFRAAEMREQDDFRALVGEFADRREDALDPGHVADAAVLHRHVEIDAHENALILYVGLVEGFEGRHHAQSRS
jgi:hypothetical protein